MKSTNKNLSVSVLALAVQGALAAMAMMPIAVLADENQDVKALTQPTSFVELGAENVSNSSDKFGEYNGLNKAGVYGVGNLDVRGGDAYNGGTMRWNVYGTDLGTTSREFGLDVGNQGSWNLGLHRDELTHYITDSFQTPFQGPFGGNAFALPSNFGIVNTTNNGVANSPTNPKNVPIGTQALSAAQQGDFQSENVYSGRKNTAMTAGFVINRQWSVQFDFNRLVQDGAKLISASSDGFGTPGFGVPQTAFGPPKGESPVMLANPTNFATDTATLAANWVGEKANFTGSLYSSIFHDANSDLSWTTPYFGSAVANSGNGTALGSAYPVDALSTLPSNSFVQLNLAGGYAVTPTTKLTGGFSYGRNTQNDSYVNVPGGVDNLMQPGGLPQNSLNGVVVTTHADLKLVDQSIKNLTLSAGFKYNERDNRTDANTYRFNNLDAPTQTAGVVTSTAGSGQTSVSTPMSNKKTQFDLGGDYRIDHSQSVRLSYDYEQIQRWCNSALSNDAQGANPSGTTAAAYYGTTATCAQVPESNENKLGVNYKFKATDNVSLNAGYSYSDRKSDVSSAFYSPLQANPQGYENQGYIAFFDASRIEQLAKVGVNWQANDRFNVGLSGKYTRDNYDDSTLGVQDGSSWSANLDGTYQLGEKSSISAYVTAQKRVRDLLSENGNTATSLVVAKEFEDSFSDTDYTLGLTLKQGGLMSGKLNLAADLTYSNSTTGWNTTIPATSISQLAACTTPSTSGFNCGPTPDITSKLSQLKLSGEYTLSKQSMVGFGVLFQHLNSDDFIYNAYQMGYTPTSVMPSNQSSPSYSVSTMYLVYRYNFACM